MALTDSLSSDLERDGVERLLVTARVTAYERLDVLARAGHHPPPVARLPYSSLDAGPL